MKTKKELSYEEPFSKARKFTDVFNKLKKSTGIILYLIIFTGAGALLNSCAPGYGYISSEPQYNYEYARPEAPGEGYIWIDGDWLWDNDAHTYVHQRGYWSRARRGRTYEAGRWEDRPEGKIWIKGRWSRENERTANRNNQNNERKRNERSTPSDRDRDHDNK
jgi:hypothetical protein